MLVVLIQLDRYGAGLSDFHEQEVAVDPDTVHRLMPGGTLTLLGGIRELVKAINEPYLKMIQ